MWNLEGWNRENYQDKQNTKNQIDDLKNNIEWTKRKALEAAKILADRIKDSGPQYAYPKIESFVKNMPINLQQDIDFMGKLVDMDLRFKDYLTIKDRGNKEDALRLLSLDWSRYTSLSKELKKDRDIIIKAIKNHPMIIQLLPEEIRNDKDIVIKYMETVCSKIDNRRIFEHYRIYMPEKYWNDQEFMLNAIKRDYRNTFLASFTLIHNKEFVLKATKIDERCWDFYSMRNKN